MKKTLLLLLAAFCGVLTAAAQDLIVKTDASRIEAKVVEITTDAVRYKKFSYPAGPTYVLPVKQIAYIRYANGETEYYAESVPAAELTPAEPAEGTETRGGEEYVVKRYEIGELYDRNGVRGIVCCLSEDGRHGLVVSLDQIYLPWSEFRKPDLRTVGTTNRSDGRENMKIVEEYIAANGLSWDDFPAFNPLGGLPPDKFGKENFSEFFSHCLPDALAGFKLARRRQSFLYFFHNKKPPR